MKLRRLLIANRGEIACRIIHTCRRLGISTVAVYSDADRDARHVRMADMALPIGPAEPARSYLDIDAILAAAAESDADAVHPGYGFLSENAGFVRRCQEAGLVFVGPDPDTIDQMGSKADAKATMEAAGVPVVPGYHGKDQDDPTLTRAADSVGYPLMIKAAAGGGGKGMRIVREAAQFSAALASARREARGAFGDDRVILERYIEQPRHLEVQVFGDRHGNVVHLYERDCSSQRRYQKIVEESPAPGLDPQQRAKLCEAGVAAARAVNYVGAGTVEFIAGPDGEFFFMEMNTRLQVEHPVTEAVTGQDLVAWQIAVAQGQSLPRAQDEIGTEGHAIEARIYAEDPANDFLPSTGVLHWLDFPDDCRIDSGVRQGDRVTVHYDPMIAKLIVHAADRHAAIAAMTASLAHTRLAGVQSNIAFLTRLVSSTQFAAADIHTAWLDAEGASFIQAGTAQAGHLVPAILLALLDQERSVRRQQRCLADRYSPWAACDAWRLSHAGKRCLSLVERDQLVNVEAWGACGDYRLEFDDQHYEVCGAQMTDDALSWFDQDRLQRVTAAIFDDWMQISDGSDWRLFQRRDPFAVELAEEAGDHRLAAPMPGKIVTVKVAEGDEVEAGMELLVMEAMKMELSLKATLAGTVASVLCAEGQFVEADALLIEMEPE